MGQAMTKSTGLAVKNFGALPLALLGVAGLWLTGCPGRPQTKGTLGAANIQELAERYKQAHRAKDIESLRAIYVLLDFPVGGGRMIAGGEDYMPVLFALDLVDVEVVEVAGDPTATRFDYAVERVPSKANDFSSVRFETAYYRKPYKLLLLGRRPSDDNGPVMEIDPCMGVTESDGRLYLCASQSELRAVAEWINTGRLPGVYRPPGHTFHPGPNLPEGVPAGWLPIVRPRP
jgi:hypothetical protein